MSPFNQGFLQLRKCSLINCSIIVFPFYVLLFPFFFPWNSSPLKIRLDCLDLSSKSLFGFVWQWDFLPLELPGHWLISSSDHSLSERIGWIFKLRNHFVVVVVYSLQSSPTPCHPQFISLRIFTFLLTPSSFHSRAHYSFLFGLPPSGSCISLDRVPVILVLLDRVFLGHWEEFSSWPNLTQALLNIFFNKVLTFGFLFVSALSDFSKNLDESV